MLAWISRGARSPAAQHLKVVSGPIAGREPSALLGFLAGEFAADIAVLWPAPHTPFLVADAARRHLACLALTLRSGGVRHALEGPFKRAVRALAPASPAGLVRALGRLGETAWSPEDYQLTLGRLADPAASKALHHADAISTRKVRVLATLPAGIVAAGEGRFLLTEDQSALLAECYDGVARRDGVRAASDFARRWAQAASPAALFERVSGDVAPQSSAPPHPGMARLVPLDTRKALADAGRRYHNCLAGRVLDGWNHYYEWLGSPGAIVSISRDHLFGWRLNEALGVQNAILPAETRSQIETELWEMDVHLGRSAWQLRDLVDCAARDAFALPPCTEAVNEAFGA